MSTPAKVPVRFLKNAPPYLTGEIAGFGADQAGDLITRGVAEAYEEKVEAETKEPLKKGGKPSDTAPAA